MPFRSVVQLGTVVAITLLLAACGGTDDIATIDSSLATIEASQPSPPTPTRVPTPTPTLFPFIPIFFTPSPTSAITSPVPTNTPTPQLVEVAQGIPPATFENLVETIAAVRPSVVRIETDLAVGSGVIFEAQFGTALVLTNYHVIEDASALNIVVNDMTEYVGIVLGTDPLRDLAVLRICCSQDFQPLPFGDASAVQAGAEVLVIGYALGLAGEATITRGIVSASRFDSASGRWVIQTDASINPGNSGGPLISSLGEILGINTFVLRFTQSGVPVEGFGFAVSEITITAVLPSLRTQTPPGPLASPTVEIPDLPRSIGQYQSSEYWYTIGVLPGWTTEVLSDDLVAVWNQRLGTTVLVDVDEINPKDYPTLSSYVDDWVPAGPEGAIDFEIIGSVPIRTDEPVSAQQFTVTYALEGVDKIEIIHWYLVGKHQITVVGVSDLSLWNSFQVEEEVKDILASFEPASYINNVYEFSIAHPIEWEEVEPNGSEYRASDSERGLNIYVTVESATGFQNVRQYGDAHTVTNAGVVSRLLVLEGRPVPSYQMEYKFQSESGSASHGMVLISLSGDDAIWLWVDGWEDDWEINKPLISDIFLRFARRY